MVALNFPQNNVVQINTATILTSKVIAQITPSDARNSRLKSVYTTVDVYSTLNARSFLTVIARILLPRNAKTPSTADSKIKVTVTIDRSSALELSLQQMSRNVSSTNSANGPLLKSTPARTDMIARFSIRSSAISTRVSAPEFPQRPVKMLDSTQVKHTIQPQVSQETISKQPIDVYCFFTSKYSWHLPWILTAKKWGKIDNFLINSCKNECRL